MTVTSIKPNSIHLQQYNPNLHLTTLGKIRCLGIQALSGNQIQFRQNVTQITRQLVYLKKSLPEGISTGLDELLPTTYATDKTFIPLTRKEFYKIIQPSLSSDDDTSKLDIQSVADSNLYILKSWYNHPIQEFDNLVIECLSDGTIDCDTVVKGKPLIFQVIAFKKVHILAALLKNGVNFLVETKDIVKVKDTDEYIEYDLSVLDLVLYFCMKDIDDEDLFPLSLQIFQMLLGAGADKFSHSKIFPSFRNQLVSPWFDFEKFEKIYNVLKNVSFEVPKL